MFFEGLLLEGSPSQRESLCFSPKGHVAHGGRAGVFQPVQLPRIPRGLEPDKSEVPYNTYMFLIKLYMQKLAPETKKRKVNLFEQKEFLFLQATPALAKQGQQLLLPLADADKLPVYPSGSLLRQEVCTP